MAPDDRAVEGNVFLPGRAGHLVPVSPSEIEQLRSDIDSQKSLMIAVATGGPRINTVETQYRERANRIRAGLSKLDIQDPNPYHDLWQWYGKWSSGDLPTYKARRDHVQELYASLLEHLSGNTSKTVASGPLREPTGWELVDRQLHKVRHSLEQAKNEEDFQNVGLLCRETLISLAQAVYSSERHPSPDGKPPSPTDAKRQLDAYILTELAGSSNEEARRHVKAAIDLANALQHRRTASFRDAAMCAEATTSAVNLIAIASGRRDPDVQ
ncbi:MAG TPA: hypothetical protein VEY88_17135 [Archangium sp.]|nr:hypothetical protein [Archangium sp.]